MRKREKGEKLRKREIKFKMREREKVKKERESVRERDRETETNCTWSSELSSLKNHSQFDNMDSMMCYCWAMSVIMDIMLSSEVWTRAEDIKDRY